MKIIDFSITTTIVPRAIKYRPLLLKQDLMSNLIILNHLGQTFIINISQQSVFLSLVKNYRELISMNEAVQLNFHVIFQQKIF